MLKVQQFNHFFHNKKALKKYCHLNLFSNSMIKYGLNNIRDLVGHKVNLKMVYDNPLCRIQK